MSTPQPTRVAVVVDAVLALFGTVEGTLVFDGPQPRVPIGDSLLVGIGDESVLVGYEKAGSGYDQTLVETIDVVCTAYSWSGSNDMKPRRDRCAEILEAVNAGLRADPTLGGVCGTASFGANAAWQFLNGDDGASCSVGFHITVKTHI